MIGIIEHRRRAKQTTGAYCLSGPEMVALCDELQAWKAEAQSRTTSIIEVTRKADAEIERLRAALETVREENDRAKRQFTNISNKILDDACRALEPKP